MVIEKPQVFGRDIALVLADILAGIWAVTSNILADW
jgi:hypothetical protein